MRQVAFSKAALRALRRMPTPTAARIREKIDAYAADPASQAANVKRLKGGEGLLRLRVGDWRVVFTDDGVVVAVEKIGPRGGVYQRS